MRSLKQLKYYQTGVGKIFSVLSIIMNNKDFPIVVGISGGVDSAVTAYLLKKSGYTVEGVFMQNWQSNVDDPHCRAEQDLTDARIVCEQLDIPFRTVNFSSAYWNHVFQYFLDEYAAGRTPNPDILCNSEIKFKAFLDYAISIGVNTIATGHYARIRKHGQCYQLLKGKDQTKDQSYFLHALNQHQLKHSMFPLGNLEKTEVRKIAKKIGLVNHTKKDSTGICFIGERKFKEFLNEYLLAQPGKIESVEGKHVGNHDGLMFYTIGQRKGIGIGGISDGNGNPWYVVDKDIKNKILIVAQNPDHPRLYKDTLVCSKLHFIAGDIPAKKPIYCSAKIRYRQTDQSCTLTFLGRKDHDDKYLITFAEKQRAISPGQYIVFYDENICLGGAVIDA